METISIIQDLLKVTDGLVTQLWVGFFDLLSRWLSRVENRLDSTGECHQNVWKAQIAVVFSLSSGQDERSWKEISYYNPLIPNIDIQILQTDPHTFL